MEKIPRKDREKKVREGEIILAAEKLFCLKGFETASMDEIAKAAEFTKRTVYQYFSNKEDLYFAVVLKWFKELYERLSKACEGADSGYAKAHRAFMAYYEFYKAYPERIGVMNYIGYVKKTTAENNERRNELMEFNAKVFSLTAGIIAEGKRDGSIPVKPDAAKVASSMIFLLTGFFSQLSISGDTFTKHLSIGLEEFSRFTLDMLSGILKK